MPDPNGVEIANSYVGLEFRTPESSARRVHRRHFNDGRCDIADDAPPRRIEAQGKDESNRDFRARVAAALRSMNMMVDAHEVYHNRYHDEKLPDGEANPVGLGCLGETALAMSPVRGCPGEGVRGIDDAYVAGVVASEQARRQRTGADDALIALVMLMGGGGR